MAHINQAGLDAWLGRCCAFLRPGGCLSVVYPAGKIDELLAAVGRRLGGVSLFFLWAGVERAAVRVWPGLVLHEADGKYTPQAQAVLRGGEGLIFADACPGRATV